MWIGLDFLGSKLYFAKWALQGRQTAGVRGKMFNNITKCHEAISHSHG